jgi:hypothetical protein
MRPSSLNRRCRSSSTLLYTMLVDLEESLRTLLQRELGRHGFDNVEVAFEAPARN